MIIKKTGADLDKMSRAGRIVADVHEAMLERVEPGMTTMQLDRIAEDMIVAAGATPSFKGYRGFPATLCTSLNHEIVHGIPSDDVTFEAGDVLSIDCGAIYDGYHADSAITTIVGGEDAADEQVINLVRTTRNALWQGLRQVVDGNRIGDIGAAIEATARPQGYGVVREYVGHGIGRALHEDPAVPNYGKPGRGLKLTTGWVLAVEPMFNLGSAATEALDDGWTVVTADRRPSAHWEHTIAITPDGPRVLTARRDEPQDPLDAPEGGW